MIRQDLKDRVIAWAEARNFFGPGGATVEGQLAKLLEEASELVTSIVRGRDATDDIGDCLVVLTILERMDVEIVGADWHVYACENPFQTACWFVRAISATATGAEEQLCIDDLCGTARSLNIDPNAALEHALLEIEPRRGSWSGGVFVKEASAEPEVPSVPEGWKLVPVKATSTMRYAFETARESLIKQHTFSGSVPATYQPFEAGYAALLAAAPEVPRG